MSEDIYVRLREFMDTFSAGFPSTPSGVEIRILKKLFSPEQAALTMKLKPEPEKVSTIAGRIGMSEADLESKLEEMAKKGLIFRVRENGKPLYQAYQFIVGFWEFQLKYLDKELCQMFEEYLPYFGLSMMSVKTKQMRVIPVGSSVQTTREVEPYNRVRELVMAQNTISVADCICRKEQGLLGKECDRPKETCLGFGNFAQFYIENKWARAISREEALSILDRAEESGLVLSPTNTQELAAVCCCCPCCCPILKYAKMGPRPVDQIHSYYQAHINKELCTACGECVERCQMDAIKSGEDSSEIVDGRCIGCGLCIATCPTEALSLIAKPGMDAPPKDFEETIKRIEGERRAIRVTG